MTNVSVFGAYVREVLSNSLVNAPLCDEKQVEIEKFKDMKEIYFVLSRELDVTSELQIESEVAETWTYFSVSHESLDSIGCMTDSHKRHCNQVAEYAEQYELVVA